VTRGKPKIVTFVGLVTLVTPGRASYLAAGLSHQLDRKSYPASSWPYPVPPTYPLLTQYWQYDRLLWSLPVANVRWCSWAITC